MTMARVHRYTYPALHQIRRRDMQPKLHSRHIREGKETTKRKAPPVLVLLHQKIARLPSTSIGQHLQMHWLEDVVLLLMPKFPTPEIPTLAHRLIVTAATRLIVTAVMKDSLMHRLALKRHLKELLGHHHRHHHQEVAGFLLHRHRLLEGLLRRHHLVGFLGHHRRHLYREMDYQ